jgi:S-adenosylmethionine hydrolase
LTGVITFTTDFGQIDGFPAQMKGVILGINPTAVLVDITHDIPCFSILEGALALRSACRWFPKGTVHVAVVDPGVGTNRHALAVKSEGRFFVGPDNGLLTLAAPLETGAEYRAITNPAFILPDPHPTFHGRDVFAPAAAHLANGVALSALGPRVPEIELLALEDPHLEAPGRLRGTVIHVDHFGNLITNVRASDVSPDVDTGALSLILGKTTLRGLVTTYSSVSQGEALIHWGSSGHLEVAVRGGSAAERLGAGVGATLHVTW